MTEIEPYRPGESLVVAADQTNWTSEQVAALRHIGVDGATEGDLRVFFHQCQRTGLDPFLRQVYMISRESSERQPDGSWRKVVKQTIQTGIDGYRLIARRAAHVSGDSLSIGAPEWAHEDGSWRPVWTSAWGAPVAARVVVQRAGESFPGVALFDEYKQTKRGGELTSMWASRPAGQIAKCAEALALRKAFPADLSGIYTDDEMSRLDAPRASQERRPAGLASVLAARSSIEAGPVEATETATAPALLDASSGLAKAMFAALGEQGFKDREAKLEVCSGIAGRELASSSELTVAEAHLILDALTAATVEDEQ